jgi:ribonuclease HI
VLALQSLNVHRSGLPKIPNYFFPPLCAYDKDFRIQTALYIRTDISYAFIAPETMMNLDGVFSASACIKVNDNIYLNIMSVYLPQGPKENNTDWIKILSDKDKENWVILGDFNAHSPMWERNCNSNTCNRFVETVTSSNFVLLNDGSFTRIPDVANHRPTAIDLSFVSPSLAIDCDWSVGDDCLGSDHLPITIVLNEELNNGDERIEDVVPKFCYNRADWNSFQSFLLLYDHKNIEDDNMDIFYDNFAKAVIAAAENSIPKVKNFSSAKQRGNVWWNNDCAEAVKHKKKCFKKWLSNRSEENFLLMKQSKYQCKKIICQAKSSFWIQYCSKEVSESKDICKVWKKIKQMKHGCNLQSYPLKLHGNIFPSAKEKGIAFLELFTKNSLTSSLPPMVLAERQKQEMDNSYADPVAINDYYLNAKISYEEFDEALLSFKSNTTAVGLDGISYQMLIHLPEDWKRKLHSVCQKAWLTGAFPTIWKKSVVVPILKEGKDRSAVDSYRPIALTSNVCKLMERIVLKRLTYHCEKYNIVPPNQAGFRKGRCTIDHLVKLSSNIKKQFAHRKSCLATFFDVKKAYDRVWHKRLLFKLKGIGVCGAMYSYVQNLISERQICTRVDKYYSEFQRIDMGIPQGSIMAPLLFTILIHDLPNALSKSTSVVQYADDVAIWINTSLRKHTKSRVVNYVQQIYQMELNKLSNYMKENGLELSGEKTSLMLFNNGLNSKSLPKLYLDGVLLLYKQSVKFLGVYFTTKLKWKVHIEYLLTKARKRLNLLKVLNTQPWSQNTSTLVHLAMSLIRLTLTYGQEVYFSASKYLLTKLQSIDSRALKIALGVPIHTNSMKCYNEIGILSLDDQRKLVTAQYAIRSLSVPNSVRNELLIDARTDYPARAKSISYLQPLLNYILDFLISCNVELPRISSSNVTSPLPPWEHLRAKFDIDFTEEKKDQNINILVSDVKQHLVEKYPYHLKIFTDGSVLETHDCGSAFSIPDLKIGKSYNLGKGFSIFTCELYAILMALTHIIFSPMAIYNILVCVDSKAALYALQNGNNKIRPDFIAEIRHLIHSIISSGIGVTFCWVPSHCGIIGNEICDRLAKAGALNCFNSIAVPNLILSSREIISMFDQFGKQNVKSNNCLFKDVPRPILKIVLKLRLNAWKTKYVKDVNCVCGNALSINHLLIPDCMFLSDLYKVHNIELSTKDILIILQSPLIFDIAKVLICSVLNNLL